MISFPHCCWLTLRFTRMCRLAMGFERPILPSARKGFPTPASDTPLFGILAVVILLLVPQHPHSFSLAPPKQMNPGRKQKPLYQAKIVPTKGGSTVPCESHADATNPSHFTGMSLGLQEAAEASEGCPHLRTSTSRPAASSRLSCPLPLPSGICHFWVPRKGSDEISRSWKDFLKQASSGKGKAHSLPRLVCLCVLKSWPAAGAGTEHTPSSGFAICGGAKSRGESVCKPGARWMLHSYKI